MSKTLNLVDSLFRRACGLDDLGHHGEARRLFERLSSFRLLPAKIAEEIQVRLADLSEEPCRRRQHLLSALAQRPENADYHLRMARAYSDDAEADAEKALPHLRAAVRMEPDNAAYLAELGSLTCRLGQTDRGLRLLKKAHRLAESNVDVLRVYVDALLDAGETDTALNASKAAMFRNSSDRRFRDLLRDVQYRAVAQGQEPKSAVILPFRPKTPTSGRFIVDGQIFRIDAGHPHSGPTRQAPSRKRNTR